MVSHRWKLFLDTLLVASFLLWTRLSGVGCTELKRPAVFWDRSIDDELSQRHVFSEEDWETLHKKVKTQSVVKLERGCGRSKNMLAILEDGTKLCCRYREHQVKELRGEIYSYFFNRLLNLWNIPPNVLVRIDFSGEQWKQVVKEAKDAGWKDMSHVVMTHFVEDISEVYIPHLLRDKTSNLTLSRVKKTSPSRKDLLLLAQWSDLIMHDFIIGHTDRLFNTLFNLQWNSMMMDLSVHNLMQTKSGQLVLLDNESGFWLGYSLQEWEPMKYELQVNFLNRLCVFRESTVQRIRQFAMHKDSSATADEFLEHFIESHDQHSFRELPKLTKAFRHELITRLSTVLDHIQSCDNHQQ